MTLDSQRGENRWNLIEYGPKDFARKVEQNNTYEFPNYKGGSVWLRLAHGMVPAVPVFGLDVFSRERFSLFKSDSTSSAFSAWKTASPFPARFLHQPHYAGHILHVWQEGKCVIRLPSLHPGWHLLESTITHKYSSGIDLPTTHIVRDSQKRLRMAKVQVNVRTNTSEQFEATTRENVGARGKKGQKIHPNFATNIAVEFHCHTFCAPNMYMK